MSKYIPEIGDVVKDNGIPVVVVKMKKYETIGDCSYDRKYLLCEEKFLNENQGNIEMGELEQHGRWVTIRGTVFPDIEKVNVAPYDIHPVECCFVRQKQARMVTVYE